ncbi:MAG: DUF4124 domain-containing protein [Gammaproteobacteria bacterium]|nr:DUF4124 domain-containing protein [Gammaproteobacteria bacterium]
MKPIGILLAIICVLGNTLVLAQGVYKWVDENGTIHYSDKPIEENAESLSIQVYSLETASEIQNQDTVSVSGGGVKIYTATWCTWCERAKTYMHSKGIVFNEYDVENSVIGRQEYKRLNGKGVPIILVGSQRMNGFNPDRLDQMLANR